jgi:hypothetical protein
VSEHQFSDSKLLDTDLAIMIVTAPIWIIYFAALIVAGAWNDHA